MEKSGRSAAAGLLFDIHTNVNTFVNIFHHRLQHKLLASDQELNAKAPLSRQRSKQGDAES
jgi:hypothetical protein